MIKALHLGGPNNTNISAVYCSAKFPGQKPPYAGQSSIFLWKNLLIPAEKIDNDIMSFGNGKGNHYFRKSKQFSHRSARKNRTFPHNKNIYIIINELFSLLDYS